jgi:hypothetical protein
MAQLLHEETVDLSFGMVDGAAPTAMPKNAVSSLLNARLEPDSTAGRRHGSIRTHPTLLNASIGYGASEFVTAGGTKQMIVFFGATAWMSSDQGANWTDITNGLTLASAYYDFAFMRVGATNHLYCANGQTSVKDWNGTTLTDLVGPPAGVKYVEAFNGRLYASGHSGVLVQASAIADPATWASPDGLTIQVLRPPTGMLQVGAHLLVFSDDETAYTDGFGEQTVVVAVGATGFSRSVGCPFFRTAVPVGDTGACWLSKRGVEYYSAGAGIVNISRNIPVFMQSLDWASLATNPGLPSGAYDAIEQNYHVALSTNGVRNNRVLVQNLLQNAQYQRRGPRSASAVDRYLGSSTNLLLAVDADGYLTAAAGVGNDADDDADGYLVIASTVGNGVSLSEDADGYLQSAFNDTTPATLFTAPSADRPSVLYSAGYDGFVRRHDGVDTDDTVSDGTGGVPVEMQIITRPFIMGRPRQRKRTRRLHIAAIADAAATVTVVIGNTTRTVAINASTDGSAFRASTAADFKSDTPQVTVKTTDDIKISLIGITAELLREQVA